MEVYNRLLVSRDKRVAKPLQWSNRSSGAQSIPGQRVSAAAGSSDTQGTNFYAG
jgi:hypothetical protein